MSPGENKENVQINTIIRLILICVAIGNGRGMNSVTNFFPKMFNILNNMCK